MVSEKLHGVLFYLSSTTLRTDGRICMCVCVPGGSRATSPGALLGHILYNDRDASE